MTLVLGTTLRPDSEPIGQAAGMLAHRLNQPLRVVHVAEDPRAPIVLGTAEEHILGPVRDELEREARRIQSVTGAAVHTHLASGPVADALVSLAEWELATALITGATTRRSRLGGAAERISRRSPVPVLTLRDPGSVIAWLAGERPLKVLVGADLGRAAAAARAFAGSLSGAEACDVEVVLVASPDETHARLGLTPSLDELGLSTEAEAVLRRDLERAAPSEEGSARLRIISGRGRPDVHLVAHADHGSFDLVVVGGRRHSVVEQIWYGSVARGVLHAAPTNVACVPPPIGERPKAEPARVVVVGTDLTEAGIHAVEQAFAVVVPGGEVHLVHVVRPVAAASDTRDLHERASRELSRVTAAGRDASLERHVLSGDPAEQLRALSRRVGANLLVVGARKRPAISRALLGSVARALVETSQIPVLLVPAQEL